tara:strand:- start:2323 stop:2721 length:399 start_codon:yes stop_codon:yes gene_type:complete
MSEKKLTFAHGLVGMFLEMTAADGKMDKVELQTVGALVKLHLEPNGFDQAARKQIIAESYDWWMSFETTKDRAIAIFGLAIGMQKALSKEERIKIAKGLSVIAAADKEIAEGEQAFFNGCLKCLGLTFEDLK